MRNFVVVSTLILAAISPSFTVVGSPLIYTPQPSLSNGDEHQQQEHRNHSLSPRKEIFSTPFVDSLPTMNGPTTAAPAHKNQDTSTPHKTKRYSDNQTAGGNAYTGNTGDVSSGNINNDAGSGTITNTNSGNILPAGSSISGDATGGAGNGRGPGGNAYTGNSGNADGGTVNNHGGTINDIGPSGNAGDGGVSRSGAARGGAP